MGGIEREAADHIADELRNQLDQELSAAKSDDFVQRPDLASFWAFLHWRSGARSSGSRNRHEKKNSLSTCSACCRKFRVHFTPHAKIKALARQPSRNDRWQASHRLVGLPKRWPLAAWQVQKLRVRLSGARQRAWHIQPPPRRVARCRHRSALHAAREFNVRPSGRSKFITARVRSRACWVLSTATASTAPTD